MECESLHPQTPDSRLSVRPRLLEIICDEVDSRCMVFLRENLVVDRYMTLSRCWGNVNVSVVSLILSFLKGVLVRDLPQTFGDAISFTYRLGVRYLWIDALCIIQGCDSTEDWRTQSALMSEVCSQSYVNLANAASHSDGGLVFLRAP